MVFVPPKDRTCERSTSNSQTVFAVTGAIDASYNAFSASMAVNDTTFGYVVEPGVAFRAGILTYSATGQVTVSTTYDSKGTFSAGGSKEVAMGMPAASASYATRTVTRYLSGSGTYTLPAGCKSFEAVLVAGGGGGSGSGAGSGNGGAGGNTTFGSLAAIGGNGGAGPYGNTGGSASGGNVANLSGGGGASGDYQGGPVVTSGGIGGGEGGGRSVFGGAGDPGEANTGGGGAGGGTTSGSTVSSGGGGGKGGTCVHVETAPSATYSYSVGAGGTSGSAGTSGTAGGQGGSGGIWIKEYY